MSKNQEQEVLNEYEAVIKEQPGSGIIEGCGIREGRESSLYSTFSIHMQRQVQPN